GGAEHVRVAETGQAGALGILAHARIERDRAQRIDGTAGGSHGTASWGSVSGPARYPARFGGAREIASGAPYPISAIPGCQADLSMLTVGHPMNVRRQHGASFGR